MRKISKIEAVARFLDYDLGRIPHGDQPALDQAWNDYVDGLMKGKEITEHQSEIWVQPKISRATWAKANIRYDGERFNQLAPGLRGR